MMHALAERNFAYTALMQDQDKNTFVLYIRQSTGDWNIIGTDYDLNSCVVAAGENWEWALHD